MRSVGWHTLLREREKRKRSSHTGTAHYPSLTTSNIPSYCLLQMYFFGAVSLDSTEHKYYLQTQQWMPITNDPYNKEIELMIDMLNSRSTFQSKIFIGL
jgi:hypothetical protein